MISAGIIVIISEISKKNTLIGGLIASIPLVSILSMIWLYLGTNDTEKVKALSNGILWMVIPSMTLFISNSDQLWPQFLLPPFIIGF